MANAACKDLKTVLPSLPGCESSTITQHVSYDGAEKAVADGAGRCRVLNAQCRAGFRCQAHAVVPRLRAMVAAFACVMLSHAVSDYHQYFGTSVDSCRCAHALCDAGSKV